jgi:hypothetical protein
MATITGQKELVRVLLDAGARKDIRSEHKKTALDFAISFKLDEIVAMLSLF